MLTLWRNAGVFSEDFVQLVMEQSGSGAVLISGVGPADDVDLNARLHAVSRIWSPQPGTNGTTGQSVPILRLNEIESRRGTILGHKLDSRYRTNVGIVNLDGGGAAQTFRINVSGTSPTGQTLLPEQLAAVTVSPMGTQQVPIPLTREYGVLQIHVAIVPAPGIGTLTLWTAYASSVDNITGDAWTSPGFTAPSDEL